MNAADAWDAAHGNTLLYVSLLVDGGTWSPAGVWPTPACLGYMPDVSHPEGSEWPTEDPGDCPTTYMVT